MSDVQIAISTYRRSHDPFVTAEWILDSSGPGEERDFFSREGKSTSAIERASADVYYKGMREERVRVIVCKRRNLCMRVWS